jgi:hypothetical protein
MAIEQTVEIPANRRITLDVPPEVPLGKVILTFTPAVSPKEDAGIENNRPRSAREALEIGRGIAKRLGSRLSSDRFLEMRHQDRILEDSVDARERKERMRNQGNA